MRIHLPLHPHQFLPQPVAGPSSPPIFQLGGDLVIIELQGEMTWEGDKANGVVGILGLDRPDKPTLHLGEHHLLHGKFTTLQKPFAVIRRAVAVGATSEDGINALQGDASEEEDLDIDEEAPAPKSKRPKALQEEEEGDEEEPPLFAADPDIFPSTPRTKNGPGPASSSPFYPASAPKDYSSELDPSSPARGWDTDEFGFEKGDKTEDEDDEDGQERAKHEELKRRKERARKKRKREEKERTRHYEVVGIVRKKVVFALRPEPIVTATLLPE